MGYPEFGGFIEEPLRGTDSIAIIGNSETYYIMDVTREGLYGQLERLPKTHRVERVYHGLDFPIILSRLEQAIKDANASKPLHLKMDFTRRLTKVNP